MCWFVNVSSNNMERAKSSSLCDCGLAYCNHFRRDWIQLNIPNKQPGSCPGRESCQTPIELSSHAYIVVHPQRIYNSDQIIRDNVRTVHWREIRCCTRFHIQNCWVWSEHSPNLVLNYLASDCTLSESIRMIVFSIDLLLQADVELTMPPLTSSPHTWHFQALYNQICKNVATSGILSGW